MRLRSQYIEKIRAKVNAPFSLSHSWERARDFWETAIFPEYAIRKSFGTPPMQRLPQILVMALLLIGFGLSLTGQIIDIKRFRPPKEEPEFGNNRFLQMRDLSEEFRSAGLIMVISAPIVWLVFWLILRDQGAKHPDGEISK